MVIDIIAVLTPTRVCLAILWGWHLKGLLVKLVTSGPLLLLPFLKQKVKRKKYSHEHIHRKTVVMVSFVVQLQPWGLTILWKGGSILDVFVKFVKFYTISFLQEAAGRLLPIAVLAINQILTVCLGPPQWAARRQFTVFVSKIFKITKVEGNVFYGWGRRNEEKKRYLAVAVTKRCCAGVSLACRRESFLKKRILHRCFPMKLSEHLFHRTHANSLTTFLTITSYLIL